MPSRGVVVAARLTTSMPSPALPAKGGLPSVPQLPPERRPLDRRAALVYFCPSGHQYIRLGLGTSLTKSEVPGREGRNDA